MLRITCAIIRDDNGHVLVVQRGAKSDHPGKWEFPGGKVEPGESDEDCVVREILEELELDMIVCGQLAEVSHDYGFKQIILVPFVCDTLAVVPMLTEHSAYKWVSPDQLGAVDFCEADKKVAANYLADCGERNIVTADNVVVNEDDEVCEFSDLIAQLAGAKEAEWVAKSAVTDVKVLRLLVDLSSSDDKQLAFHASWALGKTFDLNSEMFRPFLSHFAKTLPLLENDSVARIFLRMLVFSDIRLINSELHGALADYCFTTLKSGSAKVASKAHCMDVLYNLTRIYPELSNELIATINVVINEGSAGVVSKGKAVLKKLQ